jgi:hypothetical protein
MEIGPLIHFVIFVFCLMAVFGVIALVVIDAFSRVDYLKEKAPWLARIVARRSVLAGLLIATVFMLVGNGYELAVKELPVVAPIKFVFTTPPPPQNNRGHAYECSLRT